MSHFFNRYLLFILVSLASVTHNAFACTRILNTENGQTVLVGRTMDWYEDMKTSLIVYPRQTSHHGMALANPLKWKAKYGSIVAVVFGMITTDGFNEHGLAAHSLWLDEADYGPRNKNLKGLSVAWWAQFYLDNFQTVEEALQFTEAQPFQLEPLINPITQETLSLHLALEDASGDSAIIEYINGKAHIYHHRNYTVLTNSPGFDQQLINLQKYKGFGGDQALPGSTDSKDRFVRASWYTARIPEAKTTHEAIISMLSVVQNISEPYESPGPEHRDIEPTLWRSVSDLGNKVYYFNESVNLNFIWANLDSFNLNPGAAIVKLDLNNRELSGNVSGKFKPVSTRR